MLKRLLFSTNRAADIGKLIFFAIMMTGFFLFTANYFFDNDSILMMSYANTLLYGKAYLNSQAVVRYDLAYPLLLILSGYPFHHSLIGIALINAVMSILMPAMVYLTVRPVFPRGAYYIALAVIFSLSPFFYIKFARPDHAYMFFTVLSTCLLSLFIETKRPVFLYAMIGAVLAVSLLRAAGSILFPFFIIMAFLFERGSWRKYVICILIGFCFFSWYSHFKHQLFSQFEDRTSFNGGQTFQNLYVNSKEFGIRLSEELGPAMKTITNNLYQAVLPRPNSSSFIKPEGSAVESLSTYITHEDFLTAHVYPFSAAELIKQIYETPCWDYNYMLYIATPQDRLFLKASFEIVRHYPWYPFAFTARNMWHLLYDPGFEHNRYTLNPLARSNIQDAFPYDAVTTSKANLSNRALREINFDNFSHKFHFASVSIRHIKRFFCSHYLKYTKKLFYLMAIAWAAVIIDLIHQATSSKKLQFVADLLPKKITPLVIILSGYLFISMLIISVFVDPLLRYHNHLLPFKIMLAGMGAGILLQAFYRIIQKFFPWVAIAHIITSSDQNTVQLKQYKTGAISLMLMMLALFAGWSGYVWIHTY